MDGNGRINLRNWEFLEPPNNPYPNHLALQLMSSMDEKPMFGVGNGVGVVNHLHHADSSSVMSSINGGQYHHHRVGGISDSHNQMDYWLNQTREKYMNELTVNQSREKYMNELTGNHQLNNYYQPSYGISPETSSAISVMPHQQMGFPKDENVMFQSEGVSEEGEDGSVVLPKKRSGGKLPKSPSTEKKPRMRGAVRAPKDESTPPTNRARAPKKRAEVVINGVNMDISGIAIPVCSCTGTPQQCYRWGSGGWQSACCTMSLSVYPLPMSTKRRGARIAGRKMSVGAFKKVLENLASQGYNFSNPIDLKTYWAKHGTNKFVTIR